MTPAALGERRVPSLAHWGALTAVVRDGRVVRCEPFEHDTCPSPMLASIPEMIHSSLRIYRPCVREGWREGRPRTGRDRFVQIGWDEATALVASELRRVREAHGAEAVFGGSYGWSSAGRLHHARTLVRRFLALGGGHVDQVGNYSWGAAQYLLPHVIGTYQPVTGRVTDWNSVLAHTRLVLAFGGLRLDNGQVTSGGAGLHSLGDWLRRAKDAGIRFVVISPSRSDAPAGLGADWLGIRPNTDTALMLGMAHTLIVEGLHDQAFVDRTCVGWATTRAYILGDVDRVPKDAEWAAGLCGIAADTIRSLARACAGTRTLITCTWSLQRAEHGEQPYWASIMLAALLGQIGSPGGGFAFGHGSLNGVGVPRAPLPGPEIPAPANPARLAIPAARVTDMLLHPGEPFEFNGRIAEYPRIRLVYWAGGNPFHHQQDLNRLVRAWQRPETIVVHESWWTATARRADIVLPATTFLERSDVGGSSRDPFVFAMHRAIQPVGGARDDFDIFGELADRLGYADAFTEGRDEAAWCRHIYDGVRAAAAGKGIELPDFEAFWDKGYASLPEPKRHFVLFEDFARDPAAYPLATPSGRIELASATIASFDYDDCPGHPTWLPPREWLGADLARTWPLHLVTHQPSTRLHSQLDPARLSLDRKAQGREPVRIHPDTAARRGISDGDVVRIHNDRGACLATAHLDAGLVRDVVTMATGAWYEPLEGCGLEIHGNPNVLTQDIGTSRLTQGSSALSALVEVTLWDNPVPPIAIFTPPDTAESST